MRGAVARPGYGLIMAAGTVSVITGPAESVVCDARVVPLERTGLPKRAALPAGVARDAAMRRAKALMDPGTRQLASAVPSNDSADVATILARLPARGRGLQSPGARVDAAFDAVVQALRTKRPSLGKTAARPTRVVVPVPGVDVWFSRFEMQDGAGAILRGARAIAGDHGIDVVVAVEDLALLPQLQQMRTAAAHRWWPLLDAASFRELAEAAALAAAERAAILVGSGVTGLYPFDGFDARMRKVADRFGLSEFVPRGVGEARFLLEAIIAKCREDDSGARWSALDGIFGEEFNNHRHSLAAALAVTLPVDRVHALSLDGALDAASLDVVAAPQVIELMGNHRDPETMTPSAARALALPGLDHNVSQHVRSRPPVAVFIGLERDRAVFEGLLAALTRSVPGFSAARKVLIQHIELDGDSLAHGWSDAFTTLSIREGTHAERARVFEQMLDAFVALTWTRGDGKHLQLEASFFEPVIRMVPSSNTSVWAVNGGAPGSGRR